MEVASKAPYKNAIGINIHAMEEELRDAGVEIATDTCVDEIYIREYHPDLVIVATGSRPLLPPIHGIGLSHVYTAQDILMEAGHIDQNLLTGKILIVGGGAVGLETALFLANREILDIQSRQFLDIYADSDTSKGLQYASSITIAEMDNKMGKDLNSTRWITLKELKRLNVSLMNGTKVEEILPKEVIVNTGGVVHAMDADCIIMAAGYEPEGGAFIEWLKESGYEYKIVGDAKKTGTISEAMNDAYLLMEEIKE